jgi:hypothetical protein
MSTHRLSTQLLREYEEEGRPTWYLAVKHGYPLPVVLRMLQQARQEPTITTP